MDHANNDHWWCRIVFYKSSGGCPYSFPSLQNPIWGPCCPWPSPWQPLVGPLRPFIRHLTVLRRRSAIDDWRRTSRTWIGWAWSGFTLTIVPDALPYFVKAWTNANMECKKPRMALMIVRIPIQKAWLPSIAFVCITAYTSQMSFVLVHIVDKVFCRRVQPSRRHVWQCIKFSKVQSKSAVKILKVLCMIWFCLGTNNNAQNECEGVWFSMSWTLSSYTNAIHKSEAQFVCKLWNFPRAQLEEPIRFLFQPHDVVASRGGIFWELWSKIRMMSAGGVGLSVECWHPLASWHTIPVRLDVWGGRSTSNPIMVMVVWILHMKPDLP